MYALDDDIVLRNSDSISMMRRLRLSDERGIALVMTLGILLVTSVMLVTVIHYSSSAGRGAHKGKRTRRRTRLPRPGVNNAMAVLANPTNNALNSTLLPARTTAYEGGSVTWSGAYNPSTPAGRSRPSARSGIPPGRRRRRSLGGSPLRSTSSRRSRSRSTPRPGTTCTRAAPAIPVT